MQTGLRTGAELFVDTLEQYGVTQLFGNPGTTELPIMKTLGDSALQYRLGLHEDIAVGMAAGYASTRRYHAHHDDSINPLGVVNLHVAPGMAHGLGNLQNAAVSGVPLLVTAGNHSTDFEHEEPILSGDLEKMTEEYTKWSAEVSDVSAIPQMVRRAVRAALTPPTGPVFLSLPMDVMMAETDAELKRLGPIPNGGSGDPEQIAHAASLLEDADDPVIVLGDEVARAGPDAIEAALSLAEATGASVYSEMITAEISFPPEHDQWVSFIPPSEDAGREFMASDTLVLVGCTTNTTYIPYDEPFVPTEASIIHVNPDQWETAKNEPADAAVVGDVGLAMAAITEQAGVSDEEVERRLTQLSDRKAVARERIFVDRDDTAKGITKPMLADSLRDAAPDAFVVNESNTSKYALLSRWSIGPERFVANKNGGLGYGLPETVGAAVAWEERGGETPPVIGFIGDGSYLYYPQSLYSAARYDLDLTVVVPDNRTYRILKDGMLNIYGGTDDDYDYVGMDFDPAVDIPANAETHGAQGIRVTEPAELDDALEEAIGNDGPVVVDVAVED